MFTTAANRFGIFKSAVGKSVVRLDDRLGLKLFNRTTRRTRLTVDGQACLVAFDAISVAEAPLTLRRQVIAGRLRLDMPVAFARRILLPMLLMIAKPHRGLSLTLSFT